MPWSGELGVTILCGLASEGPESGGGGSAVLVLAGNRYPKPLASHVGIATER